MDPVYPVKVVWSLVYMSLVLSKSTVLVLFSSSYSFSIYETSHLPYFASRICTWVILVHLNTPFLGLVMLKFISAILVLKLILYFSGNSLHHPMNELESYIKFGSYFSQSLGFLVISAGILKILIGHLHHGTSLRMTLTLGCWVFSWELGGDIASRPGFHLSKIWLW